MSESETSCERLEVRRLFVAPGIHLVHRELMVIGWPVEPNTITVGLAPGDTNIIANLSFPTPHSGTKVLTDTVPLSSVSLIYIVGGKAADLITIDQTNGSFPVPARIMTSKGNDTVYGGDEPDSIQSGVGRDLLSGGGGNDSIWAQFGNDTIIGGAGNDTLHAGRGVDMVDGTAGTNDVLISGHGEDTLLGGSGVNTFFVTYIASDTTNYRPSIDHLHKVNIAPSSSSDSSTWDDLSKIFSFL